MCQWRFLSIQHVASNRALQSSCILSLGPCIVAFAFPAFLESRHLARSLAPNVLRSPVTSNTTITRWACHEPLQRMLSSLSCQSSNRSSWFVQLDVSAMSLDAVLNFEMHTRTPGTENSLVPAEPSATLAKAE